MRRELFKNGRCRNHDRLARNTFNMFTIAKRIAATGATFKSLAEPWADCQLESSS
jgi:hypothetical protein